MKVDSPLKNTKIALSHLRLALHRIFNGLRNDIWHWKMKGKRQIPAKRVQKQKQQSPQPRPLVFVSYATDDNLTGSHKFSGGEKLLNNLVLLLRRHGYEAWMVSTDGKHANWLAEHAPFLSMEEFREKMGSSSAVRCVTSWIPAKAFLQYCPKYYFWDQELGASTRSHFPELAQEILRGRIIKSAGVNRTVQAWHRATFQKETLLLRQLIDEAHWKPDDSKRIPHRVGYFDEGDHTQQFIKKIAEKTKSAGMELEFFQLQGIEVEIIAQMQTCGIFLVLNVGKSPLWGEGGPMSPQEAMACGTVPITFDIHGPWELIVQNYNGVVVPEITPASMANAIIDIYQAPGRLPKMSRRCIEMTNEGHTMECTWKDVIKFLDIPEE